MSHEPDTRLHQSIIDPTELTTKQVQREIAALKDLMESKMGSIEKAIDVAHQDLVRVPTDVQKQVGNLKELHEEKLNSLEQLINSNSTISDEKFISIQTQFKERDTRTEQTSRDSKVAVDAALQAAKEAVKEQNASSALAIGKSEAATSKQIDQLGSLIQTTFKGLDDKISDMKERLTRIEGRGEGADREVVTHRATGNLNVTIVGIVIAAIGLLSGILIAVFHK